MRKRMYLSQPVAHGTCFSRALEPSILFQRCSVTSQWWQEIGRGESIYTPLKSANATNQAFLVCFFPLLGAGCQTFTSFSLVLIILPFRKPVQLRQVWD